MTVTREDEKPWKTDLARKAAQRREQVGLELEDVIKKATSFEDALRQAVELMKKRFARYSSVTAYVADGEELAVHTALERPQGPERVASTRRAAGRRRAGDEPDGVHRPLREPGLGAGGPHERQRDGRAGADRRGPVGDPRGLERLPRRLLAAGREAARARGAGARQEDPGGLTTVSLRGVIPPLVTPFHADGGLDLEAFAASLEALAAHDFAGFLVLGSNGEAASLDEDEKLAARRRRAAHGPRPLPARRHRPRVDARHDRAHAQGRRPRGRRRPRADALLLQGPHDGRGAAPPLRGGGRRLAGAGLPLLRPGLHRPRLAAPASPRRSPPTPASAGSRSRAATSACSAASRPRCRPASRSPAATPPSSTRRSAWGPRAASWPSRTARPQRGDRAPPGLRRGRPRDARAASRRRSRRSRPP